MIAEIYGTGAHNAGAELMAYAIRQRTLQWGRNVTCAVSSSYGRFESRAIAGLRTTFTPPWYSRSGLMRPLLSKRFLETYGLVPGSRIDCVLDASGFSYGDQWGPGPIKDLLEDMHVWRRQGRKVIMLPQSFGSFSNQHIGDLFKRASENVELIFVRDPTSLKAVESLDLQTTVKCAPDFTVNVSGYIPTETTLSADVALVVPNLRVMDKGSEQDRRKYLQFLTYAVASLRKRRHEVIALCHSTGDIQVIDALQRELPQPMPVIRETHPLVLKGLLGLPAVVVGSRFHALVSAMLQAVPAVGIGWTHKYQHLFDEFGACELLLPVHSTPSEIDLAIDQTLASPHRQELQEKLREGKERYRRGTEVMWGEVERVLGLSAPNKEGVA